MSTTRRRATIVAIALLMTGCQKIYTAPSTTTPTPQPAATPTPAPVVSNLIEFRVTGDAPSATIRTNNGVDGLAQFSAVLPYSETSTYVGTTPVFVSLSAQGSASGFLQVSIFVNGVVFREASAPATNPPPAVSISGTYRPH